MKTKILVVALLSLFYQTSNSQINDFTKTDCNGIEHNLFSDLAAGNAVILNFCAGWCQPCRLADPYLEDFYQDTCAGNENIKVYGMLFEDNSGGPTDCAFGQEYASEYGLTFPIITDCAELYAPYAGLNGGFVPLFVVIIPDTLNPENSEVIPVFGPEVGSLWQDLSPAIQNVLKDKGFLPKITNTIDNCIDAPFQAVLTSNFSDGNLWSTGETTQSITVSSHGVYTLQNTSVCSEVSDQITINPLPVAGSITVETTELCVGELIHLSYTGGNGSFTWERFSNEEQRWVDIGSLTSINESKSRYPIDKFRVRVDNGNPLGDVSCIAYSEEVLISSPSTSPTISVSNSTPCINSTIDLLAQENGATVTNGLFQYQIPEDNPYEFYDFQLANPGESVSFLIDESLIGKVINFRYVGFNEASNCFLYSEPIAVNVPAQPVLNWPNCLFEGDTLTLESIADENAPIVWSTGETTVAITPTTSGTISATFTDNTTGCEWTISKFIEVLEASNTGTVSINTNAICQGDLFELLWDGTGTALWQLEYLETWYDFEALFQSPVYAQSNQPFQFDSSFLNVGTWRFRVKLGCEGNYLYSNEVALSIDGLPFYIDNDGDGYGSETSELYCLPEPTQGYAPNNTDCDDTNPNINPTVNEILDNGIDDNCDGLIDTLLYCTPQTDTGILCDLSWITNLAIITTSSNIVTPFEDCTNSGYNDYYESTVISAELGTQLEVFLEDGGPTEQAFYVAIYIDYNQNANFNDPGEQVVVKQNQINFFEAQITVPFINPGDYRLRIVMESQNFYNDEPNSCFFAAADIQDYKLILSCPENPIPYYEDADGDGFGNPAVSVVQNCPVEGYVVDNTDCDDTNANINPLTDTDGDGTFDCIDQCPTDANKIEPGDCGCGIQDLDNDGDGTPNCNDACPDDPNKIVEGDCGCGNEEIDTDGDGVSDCIDQCDGPEGDADNDGVPDCLDECPYDANKTTPGTCGCGIQDLDDDNDGTPNCLEDDDDNDGVSNCNDSEPNSPCPNHVDEFGISLDSDNDGLLDCDDQEPNSPCPEVDPVTGISLDADGDGIADCIDSCPDDASNTCYINPCGPGETEICHVNNKGVRTTICVTEKEKARHAKHDNDDLSGPCTNPAGRSKASGFSESLGLKIIPNPARHNITFEFPKLNSNGAKLSIYDMYGKLIQTHDLKSERQLQIKLTNSFVAGMYMVTINDNGVLHTGKFIVE
ncbi:putative secreted protein (Por secretion system target) [Flavobacteriaceae bacterium MAR_2010_72]|nr:putative secreted protein (Por secretion system target) [Flavobacteriaceae bacterium MAR_2010_72]